MRRLHKMEGKINSRMVGRLRAQQLNLFHTSGGSSSSSGSPNATKNAAGNAKNNESSSPVAPAAANKNNTAANVNSAGNVGNVNSEAANVNGNSHIPQHLLRQLRQQQQPPAAHANNTSSSSSNNSYVSVGASTTTDATLATTIPSSHIHIITQAYGPQACIYQDVLQIPPDMTSDREIRIAYFRRGRQVLAERPASPPCPDDKDGTTNTTSTKGSSVHGQVSPMAKMKFQAVSMAYEILSNPAWKQSYDLYGFYGPNAHREEPPGMISSAAAGRPTEEEEASLADHRPQHSPPHHHHPVHNSNMNNSNNNDSESNLSPAAKLYNLRAGAMTTTNTSNTNTTLPSTLPQPPAAASSSSSTPMPPTRPKSTKVRIVNTAGVGTLLHNTPNHPSSQNRDSDNLSCVSQSTAGTATSRSSALRKPGSFLEKLAKQKAGLRNAHAHHHAHHTRNGGHLSGLPTVATVRWNEEVEELIFRQDPEEISFKVRSAEEDEDYEAAVAAAAALSSAASAASASSSNGGRGDHPTPHPAGQPSRVVYEKEPYPATDRGPNSNANNNSNSNNNKQKVVLDTAELGSHLEKLDKVADSIADIFDELEASFDGLLGVGLSSASGSHSSAGAKQKQLPQPSFRFGNNSSKQLLPPSSTSSSSRPTNHHPLVMNQQQQQQHVSMRSEPQQQGQHPAHSSSHPSQEFSGGMVINAPVVPFEEELQYYDDASYHTPPNLRRDILEQANAMPAPTIPTDMNLSKEEAEQVEEQAMALLREVTSMEPVPPTDVVVKNKRTRHQQQHQQNQLQRQDTPSEFGTASEVALLAGQEANTAPDQYDAGDARSFCESEMGAGENTTVATSVVSLLDTQQHTNAPLKPAATTSTTGAKASRKRLKNVQRRRQQQRAKEQQQSADNIMTAPAHQDGDDRRNQEEKKLALA